MLKDLRPARATADTAGASMPLRAATERLDASFDAGRHGAEDFRAIIHMLRG